MMGMSACLRLISAWRYCRADFVLLTGPGCLGVGSRVGRRGSVVGSVFSDSGAVGMADSVY
jgi:hypothetical protein